MADPGDLPPGGVTKRAIGAIRIFDEETKFEIDSTLAADFAASIAKVKKGDIFIGETDAPPDGGHVRRSPSHHAGKKDWKPHHKRGHGDEAGGASADKPKWAKKTKRHGEAHPGGKSNEGGPHDRKPHGKARFGGKHSGKPGGFHKQPKSTKPGG